MNLSIGTLDEDVWRATEPGTPHPRRRVEAVRQLNEAGILSGVLVAPILPGLSDSPEQLGGGGHACVEAGARLGDRDGAAPAAGRAGALPRLAAAARPGLAEDYERRYQRAYLPDVEQKALAARVRAIAERAGARYATPQEARVPSGEPPRPRSSQPAPVVGGAADRGAPRASGSTS